VGITDMDRLSLEWTGLGSRPLPPHAGRLSVTEIDVAREHLRYERHLELVGTRVDAVRYVLPRPAL
jgi:hypothetical protein